MHLRHENAAKYVTYLHGPISQKLMFCNSEESNFAESEMSQGSKEHLDEGTEASTEELRVLQDEVILPADKRTMPMRCATRKSWMAIRVEGGPNSCPPAMRTG